MILDLSKTEAEALIPLIGSHDSRLSHLPDDRWLLWPVIATVTTTACLVLLCQIPGIVSFVLVPLMLLALPLIEITLSLAAFRLFRLKRYRKAVSTVLAIAAPVLLWQRLVWAAPYMHLGVSAIAGYGKPISMYGAPHSSIMPSSFTVYDWSVGFAGSNNIFLIYDLTDEIALPMAKHQHPSSFEEGWGEDCAGKVRHLLGHYYVCYFD